MNHLVKLLVPLALSVTQAHAAALDSTFVLVHGALFDQSGWEPLKTELEAADASVVTVNLPGRGGDGVDPRTVNIHTAAAKVCDAVKSIDGPVVLVGHSQGGAVITQAFGDCGANVSGLIYIAAVVPQTGETAFQGLSAERDTNFNLCVTPDAEGGLFRLNRQGPLEESFFQDLRALNPERADEALAAMVSEPIGIGTSALAFDAARLKAVPKYYVEALNDRVISLATQRTFQAKLAFDKVYSIASGHTPFLSQPAATASALLDAARLIRLNQGSFDEIFWEQDLSVINLSGELADLGATSGTVEIHFLRNKAFEVSLRLLDSQGRPTRTLTAPVQATYSDFCNVSHFDAAQGEGLILNVTDLARPTCRSGEQNRSVVEVYLDGQRSSFQGRALRAHIPGF